MPRDHSREQPQWLLARHSALTARQLLRAYGLLCLFSLTIAAAFALRDDDSAFFKLLALVADRIAVSATLVDYWRTVEQGDEEIARARHQMWRVFEEPMKRAVARGLCKQTLNSKELSLVFGMLGGALRGETPAQRKQLARRALQIILDGIKA